MCRTETCEVAATRHRALLFLGHVTRCGMLWVFFLSCIFFFFFSFFSPFFSLPVHLMNMATRCKREHDAHDEAPTGPHLLVIGGGRDPRLETRLLMLFTETTSFSPTLTCWNHHILLFCHFPFSLPLISFLNCFTTSGFRTDGPVS